MGMGRAAWQVERQEPTVDLTVFVIAYNNSRMASHGPTFEKWGAADGKSLDMAQAL